MVLPEHHFHSLFLNLQGAEILADTFPETILSKLSNILCEYYKQSS